jgi:hypothetical protein
MTKEGEEPKEIVSSSSGGVASYVERHREGCRATEQRGEGAERG